MDPVKDALSKLNLKGQRSRDKLQTASSATARSGTPTNASGGGPAKLEQIFGQPVAQSPRIPPIGNVSRGDPSPRTSIGDMRTPSAKAAQLLGVDPDEVRGRQAAQGFIRTPSSSPRKTGSKFRQSKFYPPTAGDATSRLPGRGETLTDAELNRMKVDPAFANRVDETRKRQEEAAAKMDLHTVHPRSSSSFSQPRAPTTTTGPRLAPAESINFSRPRPGTPTAAQGAGAAAAGKTSRSRSRSPVKT